MTAEILETGSVFLKLDTSLGSFLNLKKFSYQCSGGEVLCSWLLASVSAYQNFTPIKITKRKLLSLELPSWAARTSDRNCKQCSSSEISKRRSLVQSPWTRILQLPKEIWNPHTQSYGIQCFLGAVFPSYQFNKRRSTSQISQTSNVGSMSTRSRDSSWWWWW